MWPLPRRSTRRVRAGEQAVAWYDEAYRQTREYAEPYYRSRYYFIWTVIADRLKSGRCHRVLEVGCGSGQLASLLLERDVEAYTGFDFSPVAIEMARRTAPHGTFFVGDVHDRGCYDGEWDAVVCTEVLEHVERDLNVVDLFPVGTRCLCTVPDFPYESHVRHFASAEEVAARYSRFFVDFDVTTFAASAPGDQRRILRYFLFDGTRAQS